MKVRRGNVPGRRQGSFQLSRSQILVASLLVILVSVALFAWANRGEEPNSILSAFASALLAIGVVSLISEFILKVTFTNELLDLVGLEKHLHEVGSRFVREGSSIDWPAFLARGSEITAILLEPAPWTGREWSHVVSAAKDRATRVKIYLPDPQADPSRTVAEHLQRDVAEYRQELSQAADTMERTWKGARKATAPLHPASSLTIEYLAAAPAYSMVTSDDDAVLLLQSIVAGDAPPDNLALGFRARRGFMAQWVTERLREIDETATAPKWTDALTEPAADPTGEGDNGGA